MTASMAASFSSTEPFRDSMAVSTKPIASALPAKPALIAPSIRASFELRSVAWFLTAVSTAASLSSTDPVSDSMADFTSSVALTLSARPARTASSIRVRRDPKSAVWFLTAASTAASFSSMEPLSDFMADFTSSMALVLSVKPAVTAPSMSTSLELNSIVCPLMAASTAANFSSMVPASDSMADFTNSIALALSANPALTVPSTSASFVSNAVVWLLMEISTAASFSSTDPFKDSIADLTSSKALALPSNPCSEAAFISPNAFSMSASLAFRSIV